MEFVTRIETPEDELDKIVLFLNQQLANTTKAQLFIKFSHWNVKGDGFYPAHLLFDQIYGIIQDQTDKIAERITALGGIAEGLPDQITTNSTSTNYTATASDDVRTHTENLADLIGDLTNRYREGTVICDDVDPVTQDLFIEMARELDKQLYFLEASLRP